RRRRSGAVARARGRARRRRSGVRLRGGRPGAPRAAAPPRRAARLVRRAGDERVEEAPMSDSGHDQWGPGTGSSADYGYGEPTAPRYSSSPFTSAPHSTSPFGDAPQAAPGAAGAAGAAAPSSATPPPYGAVTAPYGAAPVPHDPYAGGYPDPRYVRRTNGLATVSLILSLAGLVTYGMTSVVGVILGHIARSQIKH